MRVIKLWLLLALSFLLSGCLPWGYTGQCNAEGGPYKSDWVYWSDTCTEYCSGYYDGVCAANQAGLQETIEDMERASAVESCTKYGFVEGTEGMSTCMMQKMERLEETRVSEEARVAAEKQAAMDQAMKGLGQSMRDANPPPAKTIHCNTIGTQTFCH